MGLGPVWLPEKTGLGDGDPGVIWEGMVPK